MLKIAFLQVLVLIASCLASAVASAQSEYPNKPIRIVVPYPPGGASDTAGRVYVEGLTPLLGQQIIVDYRAGAGTNIGAAFVAGAAPDGYTLYVANFASNAVNKWLYKKLTYDSVKSFAPSR